MGNPGIEPGSNRVSDGPRQPAGSLPVERKMEVLSPAPSSDATGFQSPLPHRRRIFHLFQRGERRTRTATLIRPSAFGAAPASLAGSLSTIELLSHPVRTGGRWQRTENSNLTAISRHPVSGRGQPPGWFILHARKAADLNGTVLPAHPLATEPGTPVRIAFQSAEPRIRTANLLVLSEAPLPVGLVRHAPQRACSGSRTPAASVPRRRAYRCH